MASKMSEAQPTPNLAEFRRFCDQVGSLAQEAGLAEQLWMNCYSMVMSDCCPMTLPDPCWPMLAVW